jgi:hypothetical protein
MKPLVHSYLIIVVLGISAIGLKAIPKTTALPAGIAGWSGEYSDKLLKNSVIKARLKKLLGTKSYVEFMDSFETLTPISDDGELLFASGCLVHACTQLESAIAIDVKNNAIHAAIFNSERSTRYFNERGRKTPLPIVNWASKLEELKVNKWSYNLNDYDYEIDRISITNAAVRVL